MHTPYNLYHIYVSMSYSVYTCLISPAHSRLHPIYTRNTAIYASMIMLVVFHPFQTPYNRRDLNRHRNIIIILLYYSYDYNNNSNIMIAHTLYTTLHTHKHRKSGVLWRVRAGMNRL